MRERYILGILLFFSAAIFLFYIDGTSLKPATDRAKRRWALPPELSLPTFGDGANKTAIQTQQLRKELPTSYSQDLTTSKYRPTTTDQALAILAGNVTAVESNSRFAYVFYTTNANYHCHALVNAWRLRNDLNVSDEIDIVIVTILNKPAKGKLPISNLKIRKVGRSPLLTSNGYYRDSYTKFEIFSLHEYERVIFVDSDGLILGNMDHLFSIPLDDEQIGVACGYWFKGCWLTSMMFLAKPSKYWLDTFRAFHSKEKLAAVAKKYNGNIYDMDIFNFVLEEGAGNSTLILPQPYAQLDAYFGETPTAVLAESFYAHFSHRKPFYWRETRAYASGGPSPFPNSKPWKELFALFWEAQDKLC